jgi:hypothetical protein
MADGYHLFFSDGFKMTVGTAVTAIDMRTWDGVAFLCPDGTTAATMQMADDSAFTVNMQTVTNVDTGAAITLGAGFSPPAWLEAYRPPRRYVRANGATGAVYAFQFRHTGLMPQTPPPTRSGGRAS